MEYSLHCSDIKFKEMYKDAGMCISVSLMKDGILFTDDTIDSIVDELNSSHYDGLVFNADNICYDTLKSLCDVLRTIRAILDRSIPIWLCIDQTINDVRSLSDCVADEFMQYIDVIVSKNITYKIDHHLAKLHYT